MRVIGAAYNQKGLEHPSGVPIVFFKTHKPDFVDVGTKDIIKLPKDINFAWAEVEIAFLIGSVSDGVVIAGWSVANDITADYGADCHYLLGKSLPNFCKILNSFTFIPPKKDAVMAMEHNGKIVQYGRLSGMIIQPQELVSLIHKKVGLETGDIVLSGTPYHEKTPLNSGDWLHLYVEGLGRIRSVVK